MTSTNKGRISLKGVFPATPTPFDREGKVDHQTLAENLERWNRYDLAGYVILGSNGEAVYLTEEERLGIWETARRTIPAGKLMMAGTGCESTAQTISMTRKAAQAGAEAAMVLTPHYFTARMTPDSLVNHYHAVADASPIPIVLYNMPAYTHLDMDASTVARAASHPNIVGVKDSSGNVTKLGETVRLAGPDFQVMAGSAGFFLAALVLGAVGSVLALANVAPQECIDIQNLFESRRWDEAAELQRRMIPVNMAVTARFGIAGLKASLDMLGYHGGHVRSPLLDLTENERQLLRDILSEGGLL